MNSELHRPRLYTAEELVFAPEVMLARGVIANYAPWNEEQASARERMLAFIDEHPCDAHLRSSLTGHLTASALVVDARRERGLLTFHKKLGRWLQLGGHCDGDANLAGVALREASEESGIAGLAIDPEPIDLDVHVIPARTTRTGEVEPEHLHLDTRFVVHAPPDAVLAMSDESLDLRWFTPRELDSITTDGSVKRLFDRLFASK